MDDSPKFKNQSATAFFEDGRMMRPRVPGAVPFGDSMDERSIRRANFLKEDSLMYGGFDAALPKTAEGDPAYAAVMPAAALNMWMAEAKTRGIERDPDNAADREVSMKEMIMRGQQRFNIYCAACHGYEGDGRGLVGVRWGYPVPSFHDAKYKDRSIKTGKDGYIFHTILHGVPNADPNKPLKMPAYSDKVKPVDAWAIVAYVHALQAVRTEAATKVEAPGATSGTTTAITEVTK